MQVSREKESYNWTSTTTLATNFSLFTKFVMCSSFHIEFQELYRSITSLNCASITNPDLNVVTSEG